MPAPPLPNKASATMLFLVFGAVVSSFLITTIVTQSASSEIESLSETIVSTTSPRIERLAALRATTVEVELALSRYLQEGPSDRASAEATLESSLEKLNADVQGYLAVPALLLRQHHWSDLRQAWLRFEQMVRRTQDLADAGKETEALLMFRRSVEPAAASVIDAAMKAIDFNAQSGRAMASQIKETRRRMIWLLNGLTACSVFLGLAGALLIDHQTRARRGLVEAHSRFLEARAAELEQFAGRVAHDIRNPLSAARMSAQMIETRSSDGRAKELAGRIVRSLSRADAITTGLLEFARSGAEPDPGARANPEEILTDLAAGIAPEAESARIELRFEPVPPVLVGCSTGVYLSLVSNLVRNAIKYMGETSTRRITVRVIDEGDGVRTEVVDTGSGIPADKLPPLFEPYFRADRGGQEGLGLGLATVKKLAEGHNGRVGVTSAPGKGSTFWFVLPRTGRSETTSPGNAVSFSAPGSDAHLPH